MHRYRTAAASVVVGVTTALVIVALAILPFLNPVWVGFEQGRAQAAAWTGFEPADLRAVTDSILVDLVIGPPSFDVTLNGQPVLNERERAHMRDVRNVFAGFFGVALVAAFVLAGTFVASSEPGARAGLWRRLRRSGQVIAVATVVIGALGIAFFDTAFELFHELFFPPGSFLFNPLTDRLVQLFPETFWVETTVGVGVVIIVLALGLTWLAGRRATAIEAQGAVAAPPAPAPAGSR